MPSWVFLWQDDTTRYRILGIDPGTRLAGFAVLDAHGMGTSYVASGAVMLGSRQSLPQRIGELFGRIQELIAMYQPQELALEGAFMHLYPQAALRLGEARGAILAAASQHGIPVWEYPPAQVKEVLTGSGSATKARVQAMVVQLLQLSGTPRSDAADALGLAMCHIRFREGTWRQQEACA